MVAFEIRPMYSPVVRLELEAGGRTYPLSKVGPNYVVFRDAVELPLCTVEIVMHVDERTERWRVSLKREVLPFERLARLAVQKRKGRGRRKATPALAHRP